MYTAFEAPLRPVSRLPSASSCLLSRRSRHSSITPVFPLPVGADMTCQAQRKLHIRLRLLLWHQALAFTMLLSDSYAVT